MEIFFLKLINTCIDQFLHTFTYTTYFLNMMILTHFCSKIRKNIRLFFIVYTLGKDLKKDRDLKFLIIRISNFNFGSGTLVFILSRHFTSTAKGGGGGFFFVERKFFLNFYFGFFHEKQLTDPKLILIHFGY